MIPRLVDLPTNNQTKLSLALFDAPNPRGIVQIIHGALEHKERYFRFAEFLRANGYHVIVSDNRGHGASVSSADPLGIMMSLPQLIADQSQITQYAKHRWGGLKVSLFGHSFGSILARIYLQKHDDELNGLVLTGTVNYIPVVPIGLMLANLFLKFRSRNSRCRLLSNMSGLNPNNHQWLSYNQHNIYRVAGDPLMIHEYPVKSLQTLWRGDYELKQIKHFKCLTPALPILTIVGDHDKFSGGKRGIADTISTLHKIGYQNVSSIIMPHMKHEVLNEKDHEKVDNLILKFLNRLR
ncbi:alpha/beta hydrolase [Lentilactobacillus kisonensis]|uniref:Serine aminopeptidase S33 domain-containing protein n=2 Tax=Lentilactobacillus kisonensis TaxID=481722 RepID=H1LJB5_9LACO|nr:alpha/beta hydrolase [Lentilactobacillus kisonensis]EHO48882.1 hypothetical protein HMPREF9104_02707 [Lentilactobacillus kisonensis F0435]KRL23357.1 hypothetical protein FC98_GL000082 [Lentilactobacillus kisonensis DSM 19906 = JCM 15041]